MIFVRRALKGCLVFLCSVTLLALLACSPGEEGRVAYGPRTATGTLVRTDVSLIRRGTHTLEIQGVPAFLVESTTINVSEFEKGTVVVTGTVRPNPEKTDFPVLVAHSIRRLAGEDLHNWEIPAFNILVNVPVTWTATMSKRIASFVRVGEAEPILLIRIASGSLLPSGKAQYIQHRRAVTAPPKDGSTAQDLFIQDGRSILHLHFDPGTQTSSSEEEDASLRSDFARVIGSLLFLSDRGQTVRLTGTGSGVGAGAICGGAAGLLCGPGLYCDIDNAEFGTGKCKAR